MPESAKSKVTAYNQLRDDVSFFRKKARGAALRASVFAGVAAGNMLALAGDIFPGDDPTKVLGAMVIGSAITAASVDQGIKAIADHQSADSAEQIRTIMEINGDHEAPRSS